MNIFRHLNLQRTLSLLLLFVALFSQIQLLYACDSMSDKPQHVCCCGEHSSTVCPMVDSCAMHEKATDAACCEVNYEVINDSGVINNISPVDCLTLLLEAPQPPPDIGFIPFLDTSLPKFASLSRVFDEPLIINQVKPTYLLTHRLRI